MYFCKFIDSTYMKKAPKIILIILGSLIGLMLLVAMIISPIAKSYIQKHDKELIGREVSIGSLWINVFNGSVKIGDVTLFEEDGTTPFVQFEQFDTKIKLRELLDKKLVVKYLTLSELSVNIEQDRTWFNFNSMLDHFKTDEPEPEKEETVSKPFGLIFYDINLERSDIRYADLAIGSEFNLRDISLFIPSIDLSTLDTKVGIDLVLNETAMLHTDLKLSENADNYLLNLRLSNLGLEVVEPYVEQYLAIQDLEGRIGLDLQAKGNTEHILDFDLTGEININDITMKDTIGYQLGFVDSIYANIDKFNMNDNYLNFNSIYLTGIQSAYIVYPDSTTCFDILSGKDRHHTDTTIYEKLADTIAAEFTEVQANKHLRINIADFRFDKVDFHYEDQTLPDTFRMEISNFSLTSKNFNLDENNTVHLRANINKLGKLNATWTGNINGLENHNLTLMLSNLKLANFSPYCVAMFGFPLEDGTLSFNSQNIISNGNLEGINKLQLAHPKVGNRIKDFEPQIPRIPLKLGFYILTDKDNNCNLELPISGNLNDPEFSYKKALLKVFTTLLVKVATSPFRLLASDNDGQYIPFDLMGMDFTAEEYTFIDNVASTLATLPDVIVELQQQINFEEALENLSVMMLQRAYFIQQHPEIDSTSIDYLTNEAIRSIKLNDKGLIEFAKQYSDKKHLKKKDIPSVAVSVFGARAEERLPKLIMRRNDVLLNYLTNNKGIAPNRVKVSSMNEEQMREYKKDTRYEVSIKMPENTTPTEQENEE